MHGWKRQNRVELIDGARVVVIGGGPAGSFFAIHLLRQAASLGKRVQVVILERRRSSLPCQQPGGEADWKGCNYCAGGISPRLNDVLRQLGLVLPEETIQSRIRFITIQGFWKNIEFEVPAGREMLSVYRGSRPHSRADHRQNFDSFLLDQALRCGATLVCGEVTRVDRSTAARPQVCYTKANVPMQMVADLVVVASGVNETAGAPPDQGLILAQLPRLIPRFRPPTVRHALIFELQAEPSLPTGLESTLHFVEYGSDGLSLEMCSLLPKRSFVTVTLVGPSVDAITSHAESQRVIRSFLDLPHIRKLIPRGMELHLGCACRPNLVVRSAVRPFADRVAAVGDLVTTRLYKDGILSAEQTARALATTVLSRGIDEGSLKAGYGPTLRHFRNNNRAAAIVFLLHRLVFSSSVLSRVLYQAVIHERKTTPRHRRHLERILWGIASGDEDYISLARSLVHPSTILAVLFGGGLITLRNYATELFFGLRWEGIGRFTTGVALERLEEKRLEFSRLMANASVTVAPRLEFERMYTIRIGATVEAVLEQLGRFGEPDRRYLRPGWVQVQRTHGLPNVPGCLIQYTIGHPAFCFSLELEQIRDGHLAVYRVRDGFARGGVLIFEIEKLSPQICALSIYVAFNFRRGVGLPRRLFWWCFRKVFPSFIHDVLWNHSLCQLKDIVEAPPPTASAPAAGGGGCACGPCQAWGG